MIGSLLILAAVLVAAFTVSPVKAMLRSAHPSWRGRVIKADIQEGPR